MILGNSWLPQMAFTFNIYTVIISRNYFLYLSDLTDLLIIKNMIVFVHTLASLLAIWISLVLEKQQFNFL